MNFDNINNFNPINKENLANYLAIAAIKVLEKAAFFTVEPIAMMQNFSQFELSASLNLGAPLNSYLRMETSWEFAIELAANMLGIDTSDEESSTKADDALREILNIVAGVLVADLLGSHASCHIGIPVINAPISSEPWHHSSFNIAAYLVADGQHALCIRTAATNSI